MEEFINKFHNLEGVTLRERKKSFHSLLAATSTIPDEIIENLKPKTYFERTLKVELLIRSKKTDQLLETLKTGEETDVCKIIRQKWFIEDIVKKFDPTQFVAELMPKMSLSSRTKILKKVLVYNKNENYIQELFDNLHNIYGFSVAFVLLVGCPKDKILEILNHNSIRLSATQLKSLFDKDKSIIVKYFEQLKTNGEDVDFYKWHSFFEHASIKDPVFFFEIADKFKIHKSRIGRQSTKKFVEENKEKVLEKPYDYYSCLRKDALVRKLGNEFPKFYKKGLPKEMSEFKYCSVKSFIKYYVKNKQYELYSSAFEEKYQKSLWDNIEYMDEALIEVIPEKEERDRWIEKFENRANIKKYVAKKCAMMAMCRMDFAEDDMNFGETAVKERKTIFNTLISTCKLTKDYDAFLNILKSFCERHRNSDVSILYNFIRTVHKDLDMKKLDEEHWKYLYEIITIQIFKKQQLYFPMFLEYIKFQFLLKRPVKELTRSLLNEQPRTMGDFKYDNDEFEKEMLNYYLELLGEVSDPKGFLGIQIALSIMKWNKRNVTDTISMQGNKNIFDAVSSLKNAETVEPNMFKVFKYLICRQEVVEQTTELEEIYWSNLKNLTNNTITRWFVKYKPALFKENLSKIGIILKEKNVNLVRTLKKYDHLDIPSEVTKLCLEEISAAEASKRERVVKILVYFMPHQTLSQYFKENVPKTDKINLESGDENQQKIYEIQCALAKYVRFADDLKEFLPDLLKYCRGDVLAASLPSLYRSFSKIPEYQLYSALEELEKRPVSTRKHTIFLSCLILPVEKVLKKFKQVETLEKNASVRQHMFLSCYKYFLKNKVSECYQIIQTYVSQLKKEQKGVLRLISQVHRVPKEYRSDFAERTWNILDKLKKENVDIDDNMQRLLENLGKQDVVILRTEFCTGLINKILFDVEDCSMRHSVFEFTKKFVLYGEVPEAKIGPLFETVRKFKLKYWEDEEKKIKLLKVLNDFCSEFFEDVFRDNAGEYNKKVPRLFRDSWVKEFSLEETFEENLLLDLIVLKVESEIQTGALAEQMSKTFSEAVQKYGALILSSFKNFLSSALDLVCSGEKYTQQRLEFLDEMLKHDNSPEHCALVVQLLPCGYMGEEDKEAKNRLVEKLMKQEQIVKICLFSRMKTEY